MSDNAIIGTTIGFLVLSLAFYLFTVVYASNRVYILTLKRKDKTMWGRTVSERNERMLKMDAEGQRWQKAHDAYRQDVHIVHDELNLYGEYYDLGFNKAVIILSGRTESLRYGYYFSAPYSQSGFNVLVIDSRAHGLSDGEYNTVGFEESRDALAWVRFLHETYHLETILFHGICIGAAAGMLAITSPECPNCVKGMVTEGMFANFAESMKNHLIERKKLLFPIMPCIDFWSRKYTGHSMKYGPIDVISQMDKPLLMLQSLEDKYSSPDKARLMYDMCPSHNKRLVLFEKGNHSMLRLTDTTRYDDSIKSFLATLTEKNYN